MKKHLILSQIFIIFFFSFFFCVDKVLAQYTCARGDETTGSYTNSDCNNACPTGYTCTSTSNATNNNSPVTLKDPLNIGSDTNGPNLLIGRIINAILGVVGSLALLMFIYGGLTWMMAAGSSEKVQKGKNVLIWATIGLIVIFSAYALVNLVFTGLTGA